MKQIIEVNLGILRLIQYDVVGLEVQHLESKIEKERKKEYQIVKIQNCASFRAKLCKYLLKITCNILTVFLYMVHYKKWGDNEVYKLREK